MPYDLHLLLYSRKKEPTTATMPVRMLETESMEPALVTVVGEVLALAEEPVEEVVLVVVPLVPLEAEVGALVVALAAAAL